MRSKMPGAPLEYAIHGTRVVPNYCEAIERRFSRSTARKVRLGMHPHDRMSVPCPLCEGEPMRMPRIAFSVVLVASVSIAPLFAQAPTANGVKKIGFTGGAALTYGNLTGGDFDGTKAGAGFDVNAGSRAVRGNWDLGTTARTTATKTAMAISWGATSTSNHDTSSPHIDSRHTSQRESDVQWRRSTRATAAARTPMGGSTDWAREFSGRSRTPCKSTPQ